MGFDPCCSGRLKNISISSVFSIVASGILYMTFFHNLIFSPTSTVGKQIRNKLPLYSTSTRNMAHVVNIKTGYFAPRNKMLRPLNVFNTYSPNLACIGRSLWHCLSESAANMRWPSSFHETSINKHLWIFPLGNSALSEYYMLLTYTPNGNAIKSLLVLHCSAAIALERY